MKDTQLFESVERELNRQRNNIELIASENFVSEEVLQLAGSVLTNKYAEGYPAKRYYGGCQFVDEVEELARQRICEIYGAEHANVQPHSGAQANTAVYLALLQHGDKVLGMSLADGGHLMETFDMDATNGFLDSKWYHLYCSVQRCNSALRVLNAATDEQVNGRVSRIAEMKVLRAHYYFELSRLFNKIPYFDENVEISQYPDIPNNEFTRDEILSMLAEEMLDAAEQLPASQPEVGRIHKYIALAYAAKIKLYQAYQQDETTHAVTSINKELLREVVSLCDQVTASNRYGLLDDFQGLDLVANENGKESVFAIQYSMNDGTESAGRINWSNLLNSPGGGSPYGGDGFFLPSQDLINAYQTDANGLPDFNYQPIRTTSSSTRRRRGCWRRRLPKTKIFGKSHKG